MKDSTVSARIVVRYLYRQVINPRGIPFSLTLATEPETMNLIYGIHVMYAKRDQH